MDLIINYIPICGSGRQSNQTLAILSISHNSEIKLRRRPQSDRGRQHYDVAFTDAIERDVNQNLLRTWTHILRFIHAFSYQKGHNYTCGIQPPAKSNCSIYFINQQYLSEQLRFAPIICLGLLYTRNFYLSILLPPLINVVHNIEFRCILRQH